MITNLQMRLAKLKGTKLRIYSLPFFDEANRKKEILSHMPGKINYDADKSKQLVASFKITLGMRNVYQSVLLTREQEQHLFRKMHFYKYKASKILEKCDVNHPRKFLVEMVEKLLDNAKTIKQELVSCNYRLVVDLAKKRPDYFGKQDPDILADIISDGNLGLLDAVDYFDFRQGNKFSTYATVVIRRKIWECYNLRGKYFKAHNNYDDILWEQVDYRAGEEPPHDERIDKLMKLLAEIKPRERNVIIESLGLFGKDKKTYKKIGQTLKISKERVRQLRERGLDDLRRLAGNN